MAFHIRNCVGTRDDRSFAVQWLACALPCRRFADSLADVCARLRADAGRYSLPVSRRTPITFTKAEVAAFPEHVRCSPQQQTFIEASGTSALCQWTKRL